MKAKAVFYVLIGLFIITLAGSGYLHSTLRGRFNRSIETIAERQIDIQIADEREHHLRQLQQRLQELHDVRVAVENVLPKEKNQSVIVAQLVEAGRKNGIRFSNISFETSNGLPSKNSQVGKSSISSQVSSVPVRLQSSPTTYGRTKGFLADINELQRHASMKTLTITKQEADRVTFSVEIEVHTDIDPPAAPKKTGGR